MVSHSTMTIPLAIFILWCLWNVQSNDIILSNTDTIFRETGAVIIMSYPLVVACVRNINF
jgi:hypothetical protein